MTLINTGIGYIFYGAPILLILLTIVVSIIEAICLKKYTNFWNRLKKLAFANLITSLLGIAFIIFLNIIDGLSPIANVLTEDLKLEKFSVPYLISMSLIVALPNYAATVVVEWLILKRTLSDELWFREVAVANLISYLVLLSIWILFTSG